MKGATETESSTEDKLQISIHAPMKGATVSFVRTLTIYCISIHAPMKGATIGALRRVLRGIYFNPRTHEGCDYWYDHGSYPGHDFNPRTHEGCDNHSP